jgi:hypothetical protein
MYILSKHPYEVEIKGILIPKRKYSFEETNFGKRPFIEVTDEELEKLNKDGVFNSLLSTKQYEILKNLPDSLIPSSDKIRKLEKNQLRKTDEIRILKKENDKLRKELENLKNKDLKELENKES